MGTRRKRKLVIVLSAVFSAVLVTCVILLLVIHSYINKMNLIPQNGHSAQAADGVVREADQEASDEAEAEEDVDPNAKDSSASEIDSLEEDIRNNMEKNSSPVLYDKDVFNVLLIGCDTRKEGGSGRSDVMMLISFNKKSKQIIATSFLRDIYLQIPGKKNNRLNAAYAYGGADLLMDTIEQNFKIKIDQYASIDFYSFIDIVDAVGGVTIDVTQDEVPVMNDYLKEINRLLKDKEGSDYMTSGGTFLLNGKQALAYLRDRYVGNGDFERTWRQRNVLEQIFLKVKDLNIIELKELLDKVLPKITTNLTEGEMFSLILSLPSYMDYERVQWSVPEKNSYKSMRIHKMAVLGIDFDQNIADIQAKIYGENKN